MWTGTAEWAADYQRAGACEDMLTIINADDFGLCGERNRAVLESIEKGYCSSTTIMVNMPGFDEACEMVCNHDLNGCVGIHFVITEGAPVSDSIRRCGALCKDGLFVNGWAGCGFYLASSEKLVLAGELRAQVGRCRKAGLNITHADSHLHVHERWGIGAVVMAVCREEGIPYLRLARNCGRRDDPFKSAYRYWVNRRLAKAGLAQTSYFGSVPDCEYMNGVDRSGIPDSIEIMTHPGYDAEGELVDTRGTGRDHNPV